LFAKRRFCIFKKVFTLVSFPHRRESTRQKEHFKDFVLKLLVASIQSMDSRLRGNDNRCWEF
ncbi:MAG TPA: hypothetical protein VEC36_02650, partial [Patescibacteria group bacterium]|nr:hypothetical protein [Patescibacteria group bacterium]